ncbi:MAG: D-glycero-beta-D-manno-heptose 1-phosphate adenylyltransferase [Desulfovibrionaceae bacterium]|nr:D-glycero-beta-D-manno-heptose 1-phosphate adenylyltransferase [Desulfovibrionaceae bacterium]
MLRHPKIKNWQEAAELVKGWQEAGLKVVFTNGCFDILHAGHVDLLARARAEGDRLLLGLNSDASVRRLGKSPERPVNPQEQRAYVLAHLESVDAVTVFEQDTPLELIEAVQPDVLVKGGDWPVDKIVGAETVKKRGGIALSLPLLENYSTTAIVEKLSRK